MVLHNPNNWHWVNKDVSGWSKKWFDDNLTKIEAKEGDVSAKISKVVSMDGDCDVAQRKGKVITIFDVKLTLEFTGTYFHRIISLFPENPLPIIPSCDSCPCRVRRLKLCPAGSTADGDEVSGTITVPEVSHELDEDEFVVGCTLPGHNVL